MLASDGPLDYLHDFAANLHIAIGVGVIYDHQGNAGIATHVSVLGAAAGRVDADIGSVEIEPEGRGLRAAIGHEGAEDG